ncbi:hypothetical protein K501DRAFT_333613 [Backusella circina FSU 941]|nr:hypothetical protein K501DRAFT_333613 [Backusella circina FSU 941]
MSAEIEKISMKIKNHVILERAICGCVKSELFREVPEVIEYNDLICTIVTGKDSDRFDFFENISYQQGKLKMSRFVRPVHRYYSEEETTHDGFDDEDDEDYDCYEEEEALVNNPLEELRRRTLYTQSSVSVDSPFDQGEVSDIQAAAAAEVTTRTLSEVCPYFLAKTIETTLFVLFMVYWIIKEPVIRIATFITMIVSGIFIAPLSYIWSKTSRFMPLWVQELAPRAGYLHRRAIISTIAILCVSGLIFNWFDSIVSYLPQKNEAISLPPLNDPRLADMNSHLKNINSRLDAFSRDLNSQAKTIQEIRSDQGILEKKNKDLKTALDKSTKDHQLALDKSKQEQQEALKSVMATVDRGIDSKIKSGIHSILPKTLFVHTDETGHLSLPDEVIEILKEKLSWDKFLKFNDQATYQFLHADYSSFLQGQVKEGAVVSKELFLDLLDKEILEKRVDHNIVDMIQAAIHHYHQDVMNSPDYAAEKRGALVIPTFTSSTYHDSAFWRRAVFGALGLQNGPFHGPQKALDPHNHVGSCWCMMGDKGTLGIQLSRPITITNFTIEHPSLEVLAWDTDSAPKDIELWGLPSLSDINRKDVEGLPETGYLNNGKLLAQVRFDIQKNIPLQTFQVESVDTIFEGVILSIRSNWGNEKYTDLYRVRVHGFPSFSS